MLAIQGAADCPTPAEVSAALSAIVIVADGRLFEERGRVERDGPSVRIVLESKTGEVLATRALHAEGTCEDLAAAAAVVLASWLGDAYPDLVSGAAPDATQAVPAEVKPPPPASHTLAPTPAPARIAVRVPTSPPAAPAATTLEARRIAASAALGAAVSSAGAAPIAAFGASWIAPRPSLGAWVGLALSGVREQTLGPGIVRWSRWPVMAGPLLRLTSGPMRADIAVGGAVAWLRLEGDGFSSNGNASDLTYGAFASAKLSVGPRVFEPFLSVHGLVLAKSATATLNGPTPADVDLPPVEAWFTAGVAVEP